MRRADYNPDREGHVAKKWEVIRATRRDLPSIDVDGKQMKFGRDGAFRVNDEGGAAAIRGGDIVIFSGAGLKPPGRRRMEMAKQKPMKKKKGVHWMNGKMMKDSEMEEMMPPKK